MKKTYCVICISLFLGINLLFAGSALCENYSKGKIIYKNHCTVCHRIKSEGTPESAYQVQYKPLDFTTCSGSKNLSPEKIYFVLRNGKGVMKPVKLSAEESKALVGYLINDLKRNCE